MKFDIPLNFTVQADSEKEAEERIKVLMRSLMRTDGQDLGIVDWEFFEFIHTENETPIT